MPLQKFPSETILIKENQLSRKMFIIKKGNVRVFKDYMGQKVTLAVLGAGEMFGELSFFDAEPRSASVETITEVEAIVVDPEKADGEIGKLPDWIHTIFKSVFYRFRELDRQLMVLQSMNDFQKRRKANTNLSQNIYVELKRFNKLLSLLVQSGRTYTVGEVMKEVDQTSGQKFINLRQYFKMLVENNIVEADLTKDSCLFQLREDQLNLLDDYLNEHFQNEKFLLLGHGAMTLLSAIVGYCGETGDDIMSFDYADYRLNEMPLFQESLKELIKTGVVIQTAEQRKINQMSFNIHDLHRHYIYQTMLKNFDHAIMHIS